MPWLVAVALLIVTPLWRLADLRAQPGPLLVWGVLLCLAWIFFREDRWMTAFLGYAVVNAFTMENAASMPTATLLIFGAVLCAVVRDSAATATRWLHGALLVGGGVQIILVAFNALTGDGVVGGSIGNTNYLGAYLALSVAIVPTPWLPVWAIGIILCKSTLAGIAFGAALVVRYRQYAGTTIPAAVTTLAAVLWWRGMDLLSWRFRWAIWRTALTHLWSWRMIFGYGAGAWAAYPFQATADGVTEIFAAAHNEYLQLVYEFGLVGLLLLAGWVWAHRTTFGRSEYAPALVALAVESVAMFPLHIAAVAIPVMVVLGLATRRTA